MNDQSCYGKKRVESTVIMSSLGDKNQGSHWISV